MTQPPGKRVAAIELIGSGQRRSNNLGSPLQNSKSKVCTGCGNIGSLYSEGRSMFKYFIWAGGGYSLFLSIAEHAHTLYCSLCRTRFFAGFFDAQDKHEAARLRRRVNE